MALRIDSVRFREWARLCLESLADARDEIDALNVFPVPDSDTGTNAYFTFVSGVEALEQLDPAANPIETMRVFAEGLLIGARGNCGTILAELIRKSRIFDRQVLRVPLRLAGALAKLTPPRT